MPARPALAALTALLLGLAAWPAAAACPPGQRELRPGVCGPNVGGAARVPPPPVLRASPPRLPPPDRGDRAAAPPPRAHLHEQHIAPSLFIAPAPSPGRAVALPPGLPPPVRFHRPVAPPPQALVPAPGVAPALLVAPAPAPMPLLRAAPSPDVAAPPPRLPTSGPVSGGIAPPPLLPAPAPAPREAAQLTPVRAFLRAADIPPPGLGAYGVMALRAKPTPATTSRLHMACAAFISSLERQSQLPASIPAADQMLTIWPLDDPAAARAKADDCDFALDHYDLYGADSAIRDAEQQGAQFGDDGPFLIGWSPSTTRGKPDQLVLVVDMSSFNSQDSFDHAFLFWKERIVEDPALWRSGFSVEKLRLTLHDFVDTYGQAVVDGVKIWSK